MKNTLHTKFSKALVTGASTGLGEGFVQMLLEEGLEVWGTSRQAENMPIRDGFHPVELDLSDKDSLENFRAKYLCDGPSFDLVINNAGYGVFFPFEKFPHEEISGQIDVLLSGPIKICREVYGGMLRRGHGTLVNVSSLAVEFPLPYMSLYNTAKSGLSAFSRSLMMESRNTGVTVIDFRPGDFRTSFNAAMKRDLALVEETPQLSAAWDALERMLNSGPSVDIAVRRLRKTLLKPRSATVRTGRFFQAIFAPFISRFLPRDTILWFLRRYYGLR